jgi:hypothetical protein
MNGQSLRSGDGFKSDGDISVISLLDQSSSHHVLACESICNITYELTRTPVKSAHCRNHSCINASLKAQLREECSSAIDRETDEGDECYKCNREKRQIESCLCAK